MRRRLAGRVEASITEARLLRLVRGPEEESLDAEADSVAREGLDLGGLPRRFGRASALGAAVFFFGFGFGFLTRGGSFDRCIHNRSPIGASGEGGFGIGEGRGTYLQ